MSPALFSPFTLRGLELPNRIVVSPMCQYSAEEGCATDWHLMHLGGLAMSGAGLVFVEATAVEPAGRITPHCLGLYSDANEEALGRVVRAVRRWTPAKLALQIAHSGRKGSSHSPWDSGKLIPPSEGGWPPLAPSAIPYVPGEDPPRALDEAGLDRIRGAFVATARRAARLGFDGLELHCAHGYLLHEFLSPLSNQRTDRYGGTLENRMRYPLAVIEAVRAVWPEDRPLGIRVSSTDWVEGGWDIEDTLAFVREAKRRGVDWIDTSSAGAAPHLQKVPSKPGVNVPFAERIRREAGIATMVVGLITEPRQAEEIVASGQSDLVALARAMLWDPRWGWHAAAALGGSVSAPPQHWRGVPRDATQAFRDFRIGMR